jgi:hypothetical protein
MLLHYRIQARTKADTKLSQEFIVHLYNYSIEV